MVEQKMKTRKYPQYNRWGRIIVYSGSMGSGMTLGAVIQLVRQKTHRKIISNITLNGIEYEKFNPKGFPEYTNSIIFLDMAYMLMDSRQHQSTLNIVVTQILAQARKADNVFILTTHDAKYLDKRVRYMMDSYVVPYFWQTKYGAPRLILTRQSIGPGRKRKPSMYDMGYVRRYFKYYDTFEVLTNIGALRKAV